MVNINNNFNVIPWYSALKQQNHKKWYAFGNKWPLIMPNTKFLPFQFILESFPTSVGNIVVHSLDTQNAIDLGVAPIVIQNTEKGYCVVMLPPNACALASALPVGQYYATLSLDDITLYSEVFTAVDNIEKYLKITYWNDEALYYKSGEINYSNDFRYELYLDASIGKPEYEFSEELTTRLGYKFLESQISNKLYKFIFLGPEFICDAMRLIRLSDYIKIESASDSYNAISFAYEPNWETQGDLASIEVSFETDTIIQKLPSFNRSQRENFYNALLASTAEPLLFDEGVIAQYYTAFSESITGKLIRQLADISVEEITENTVIPVDQGTGAAQRVKLLNLLKRYGGKGLDEEALANYLVNNSYATQAWVRQQEYAKQRDIDSILDWFELRTLESGTKILFTKYTLVSALDQIAGGVGEGGSSSSGAAYNRLDTWENYNENAGDVLSATLGYGLKTEIENIQNTIADGVLSSVTIKLGSTEYKAVNGVISLPAYPIMPDVPTLVSELQNDAGYITNAALGGYATQSWVQQQKYLTSIPSEYITATGLSSTLVNYQRKITSSNKLDYSLLENTPTIPSAVTESTVSGWGFTKNAGTVTEVKMNGASKTPTNGVIDLGSVITAHQDLSNYATLSDIGPLDERLTIIESNYLDSITQQMVIDALDYTPFDSASFTKANIKSALGIADWALASSKPSYSWGEITSKPTLLSQFTDDVVAGNYLPLTGGILSGTLSAPNISITSAAAVAHLAFGRQGGNIITAPSGGYLTFIPGGKSIATANADLVITDGIVYPGTTGVTKLGFGDKRWSQVSSVDGDFSGALTAGTFSTANVVSCGGRLRINASNSVTSFGFLKSTAYTASLNRAVLDIGSNYGGSSDITSEAVDVVAMSMYRGAVGIGRAFTYDELYANRASNVMLSVEGNINNVGDIVSTGEQVAGSDMRYKIVKSKFRLSSAIIAHAPLFRFKWKNHKTTKLKIGTSAQYWEEFAPELVTFDSVSDFKHLNYAGLGVAIGISNAREIEQLKKEIVSLKERLSKYEHN